MNIRENYLARIRPLITEPIVKVLTGLRGSGKTSLLQMVQDELREAGIAADNIIYLNLELMQTSDVNNDKRLLSYLKYRMVSSGMHFVFLDEIQAVSQWELAVAELAADAECDLYLAASDTKRIVAQLSEVIPGRFAEIRVTPLSFAEYSIMNQPSAADQAAEYLSRGGLPILHGINDPATAEQISLGLYHSILYHDVVLHNHIRDVELLNRIIRFVMTNVGKIYAVRSIGSYLKGRGQQASAETIANYLRAMEEAGLIFRVPRYDLKAGTVLHNNVKYYLADHGLLQVITGLKGRNSAGVLQNAVFLELNRRGYHVYTGKLGNETIDFAAEKNGSFLLIQILERTSEAMIKKAIEPFAKNKQKAACYLIARDTFSRHEIDGVSCLNVADFLLSEQF